MTSQPTTPAVYEAIVRITNELSEIGIGKNRKNDQQHYAFRGVDDVYNALAPLLAKHGLCMLPKVLSHHVHERSTKSGGVLICVVVNMSFTLVASKDGSSHEVVVVGEAMDSGDKATNKAMSAAYKYAAFMSFAIPTEGTGKDTEEDDPRPEVAPRIVPHGQHHPSFTADEGRAFALALGSLAPSISYDRLAAWLEGDSPQATAIQDKLGVLPSRPSQWEPELRKRLWRLVSKDPARFITAMETSPAHSQQHGD